MDNSVASILLRIEAQLKRLADAQEASNAASARKAEPRDPFEPARLRSFGVPYERPPCVTVMSAEEAREILKKQDDLAMVYTDGESFAIARTADLDRDEEREKREDEFFVDPHEGKGRTLNKAEHHGKWMARVEPGLSRVPVGSVGEVAFPEDETVQGFSFVRAGEFVPGPEGGALLHHVFDPRPEFYDCGRWVDDRPGWLPIEELAEPFRAAALALRRQNEGAKQV